jgi:hypothetical protein
MRFMGWFVLKSARIAGPRKDLPPLPYEEHGREGT